MSYDDIKNEIASDLWANMYKGPLVDEEGNLKKYRGLSGGEQLIWEVCAAIYEPQVYRLPPLNELKHRLSDNYREKVIDALSELINT